MTKKQNGQANGFKYYGRRDNTQLKIKEGGYAGGYACLLLHFC